MKKIIADDLEDLSVGSAVLGSGGGGDPSYSLLMVKYLIEKYGPINLITLEELQEDDFIVPLSLMGAPLINMERILSGRELETLLKAIETRLGRKPTVLMPAEIGGANAFTPLIAAAKSGLPVLDGDMMGRAFPELQMSSCYLKNLSATPAVMADCLDNTVVIDASNADSLERIARSVAVAKGSSCAVGFYLMTKRQAQDAIVPGTVTQALEFGRAITRARKEGKNPVAECIRVSNGTLIGSGTLIDIDQTLDKGFLQGSATILNLNEKIQLFYQNEYLLAKTKATVLGSTPDLLVLLEENSGTPISSEALRYGLQVALLAIPSPEIWKTPEGLKLVGPEVFGYNIDYQPTIELITKG